VPEITPTQVHNLLTATQDLKTHTTNAAGARDRLGRLLLDTARQAKTGLKELSAVTGLHHSTIHALMRRAAGPSQHGWNQPELPVAAKALPTGATRSSGPARGPGHGLQQPPLRSAPAIRPTPRLGM
jgi:hypothetical protein